MASTYENDLRLEEMATGENSGSWGTKTNTNLELIADAFSYGTETIADADTTITIADGAADAARSLALKINSSADLTTTRTITLAPNTTSKVWIIENNTSGGQTLTISAGSGSNITLANGKTKIIATDGIGAGSNVVELTQDIAIADLFVDDDLTVGDDIIMDSDGGILKIGADADLQVTHSGSAGTITNATGDLTLDVAGDIILDAAGTQVILKKAGTQFGEFLTSSTPDNLYIKSSIQDKDIIFGGNDGGSAITALTLDMSEAGAATFNAGVTATGLTVNGTGLFTSTAAGDVLEIKSTDTGAGSGPDMVFYRAATGATSDALARLRFYGQDASSNLTEYASFNTSIEDASNGSEDGRIILKTMVAGTLRSRLDTTSTATVINQDGVDLDFRVESSNQANMIFVDAGNDRVGIQTAIPSTTLQVDGLDDGDIAWFRGNGSNAGGRALRFGVGNTTRTEFPTYLPNIYSTSSDSANGGLAIGMYGGTSGEGAIQFWTGDSSSFAEKMRIQRAGNIVAQYGAVFNEGSNNSDFRVESDSNTHALFVDAGNNRVAVGTGSPQAVFNVQHSLNNSSDWWTNTKGATYLQNLTGHTVIKFNNETGYNASVVYNSTSSTGFQLFDRTSVEERLGTDSNELVINEGSQDFDFRVESDSSTHGIHLDASISSVGLNVQADSSYPLLISHNGHGIAAGYVGGTLPNSAGIYTSSNAAHGGLAYGSLVVQARSDYSGYGVDIRASGSECITFKAGSAIWNGGVQSYSDNYSQYASSEAVTFTNSTAAGTDTFTSANNLPYQRVVPVVISLSYIGNGAISYSVTALVYNGLFTQGATVLQTVDSDGGSIMGSVSLGFSGSYNSRKLTVTITTLGSYAPNNWDGNIRLGASWN